MQSKKNVSKKQKKQMKPQKNVQRSGAIQMAPTAINRSSVQSGRNSQRYRECERVGSILGSNAFATALSLQTNPGLSNSFPWLSGHANLFEKYKVHKLVYRYKNLKGTSTDGNIILSYDYDTLDSAPGSAIAATQSTHYIDGAPWRIFELRVPTDGRILFTRSGIVLGTDLKTYDMGQIHISTEGCVDNSVHGYLEVEYDIELLDKQPSVVSPSSAGNVSIYTIESNFVAPLLAESIMTLAPISNLLNVQALGTGLVLPVGNFMITARTTADNGEYSMRLRLGGVANDFASCAGLGDMSGTSNTVGYVATVFVSQGTVPERTLEVSILTGPLSATTFYPFNAFCVTITRV